MEDLFSTLLVSRNELIKKVSRDPGALREKLCDFAFKIAPKYECPEELVCHVCFPDRNCFYWKGADKMVCDDEIETYNDSYGFCPTRLDFLFLIGDNLRDGKNYDFKKHKCNQWLIEYFEADLKEDDHRMYEMCIICGKEFDIIDLKQIINNCRNN